MNFISKMSDIWTSYGSHECQEYETYSLLGIREQTPPLAVHYIFAPMTQKLMDHLIDSYTLRFPQELMTIYSHLNGCALFWDTVYVEKFGISVPFCKFAIFGVPFGENQNTIEPWNISIEDLNRPKNTPATWLKFGMFYDQENSAVRYDLFVDTISQSVHAVENGAKTCHVSESWDSIDICLCAVLERFYS